jgi:hypothetical protein
MNMYLLFIALTSSAGTAMWGQTFPSLYACEVAKKIVLSGPMLGTAFNSQVQCIPMKSAIEPS